MSEADYTDQQDAPAPEDNGGDTPDFSYSPAGDQAPEDQYQWPAEDFSTQYNPGEIAPIDEAQFSSPTEGAPTEAEQAAALKSAIEDALGGGWGNYGHYSEDQLTPEQQAAWNAVAANPDSQAARTGSSMPTSQMNWYTDTQASPDNNWNGWGEPKGAFADPNNPISQLWGNGPPPAATVADWLEQHGGAVDPNKGTPGTAESDAPVVRVIGGGHAKSVGVDQARVELAKAGFPGAQTADDATILAAYARTATGAVPPVPTKASSAADFQKYVDAVVKSNQQRYSDERSDKAKDAARADRSQKLSIITELLRSSTGPGGPRNLHLALALLQALDNITPQEQAILQAVTPPSLRNPVAAAVA